MTRSVSRLVRHPIKGHGREEISRVSLEAGATMPWDRVWAVAHEASDADGSKWVPCAHFSRVAKASGLAALTAELDTATGTVTLRHPDLGSLTVRPDDEGDRIVDWTRPLIPDNRAASARVVRSAGVGWTDSSFPSITLCNMASHRDMESRVGRSLSIHRWRGNIWFDGAAAWEELDWVGREIRVGSATLLVRERTERCVATHANPATGERDADMMAALRQMGHCDFSVLAEVVIAGSVSLGDAVELL